MPTIRKGVSEGMVYVESSAGAVVAAPNLEFEKEFDDRKNPKQLPHYKDLILLIT